MRVTFPLYILFVVPASFSHLYATVTVTQLTPSVTFPQPVGTPVTWTAVANDSNSGPLAYRFSVRYGSRPWNIVRDFSPLNSFQYTVSKAEGLYRLAVVAKDLASGQQAMLSVPFQLTSLAQSGPVATPTANPLVALFSVPACPAGSLMRATFQLTGSSTVNNTNWNTCNPPNSSNVYIAGMYAASTYTFNYQISTGGVITTGTTPVSFTTGTPNVTFASTSVLMAPTSQADPSTTLLLHSFLALDQGFPVATDLAGAPLWYYSEGASTLVTRPLPGGTILTVQDGVSSLSSTTYQLLREIDFAGNIVRETNAGIVSQQLLAMGTDPIGAFHHEALRLPNGNTAVLGSVERLFPAGTQGSTTGQPVDVLGSMVIVLDPNFQVLWAFDEFDHAGGAPQLDINRPATLGETCYSGYKGCPPIYLASIANDWTHTNSIYYIPSTGDLLVSTRNQDWVYKIDYQNGSGTGNIVWRMGLDGDFAMVPNKNYYPWFSHQHDVKYEYGGTQVLSVFDNGNLRVSQFPGAGSRGEVFAVDETNMQVTLKLVANLGVYSKAFGSAQLLPNGDYLFQPGVTNTLPLQNSYSIEVTPKGVQTYNLEGVASYRAFGMSNLYFPPVQ